MADRAHAVSVLVEYLVRSASFGSANDRVSARYEEAAAHSARRSYSLVTAWLEEMLRPRRGIRTWCGLRPIPSKKFAIQTPGSWDKIRQAAGFHEALLEMLQDSSPVVRGNAALVARPLRRCQRASRDCCAPSASAHHGSCCGHIVDSDRAGTPIHQGGLIAKLAQSGFDAGDGDSLADSGANTIRLANWSECESPARRSR